MAAVNLSTTSDEHGQLGSGWTQEESASPHVIGDTSGETRQTTFSAIAKADSDLMIGKSLVADGPFDSTGVMLETTLAGDMVSTSSYDIDSLFLPRRTFPPVASGYEEDILDLFQRIYGEGSVTVPWTPTGDVHAYYPLRGYRQGFTLDGQNTLYRQGSWDVTATSAFSVFTQVRPPSAIEESGGFLRTSNGSFARIVRPLWSSLLTGTNVNWASYTVHLATSSTISSRISISTGFGTTPDTILECTISRTTGTSGTIGIEGQYAVAGAGSPTTVTLSTVPTTGLDMSKEITFVLQWGFLTSAQPGATLRVKMYAFDPDFPPGGAPSVVLSTDFVNTQRNRVLSSNTFIYRKAGSGAYGFRDLILSQTDSSWPVHYPVIPEPALIVSNFTRTNVEVNPPSNTFSFRAPTPSWDGSGWDYLKMLAAARGLDMRVSGGTIVFSDLFPVGTVQPLSDAINAPVLRISAQDRSRSIDVTAHRSIVQLNQTGQIPTIWLSMNATVRFGDSTNTQVGLPEGMDLTTLRLYPTIFDADDIPVDYTNFWQGGGRLLASINATNGNLNITIKGPTRTYTGLGTGPWRFEDMRGTVNGSLADPETITLYTGAPESMVTREKGGNVDNPFLNTQADVYDRSTWLISREGSPRVSLTFSVPAAARERYPIGQIVSYGWGQFRVMDTQHSKATTDVTCEWFATQDQQSLNWAGQTANQWNTYWSGKRAYDVFLRPLASSVPVVNPQPFIRVYPSESTNPVKL